MRKYILGTSLVVSLTLNVLIVAVSSVSAIASKVFEGLTGIASVVGTLQDQVVDLRGQSDAKSSKISNLEADLETKSARIKALEGEVETLKPRQVSYRGQKRTLTEAIEDTTERVSRRTTLGTSRNVAATFGESVPMLGIAVVVGATAWEIKDACDTMKDLHELEVALDPTKANDAGVREVCGMAVPTKEELWEKVKSSPGAAWAKAKDAIPDLPDMPDYTLPDLSMPDMPDVDWTFWD